MKERVVDVAVIGGGCGGLAAAIEAHKAGAKVLLLEKGPQLGGILNQCIHVGFGLSEFKEELTGPEFAARFIKEAKDLGIECILGAYVLSLGKDISLIYTSLAEGQVRVKAGAIVVAAGSLERSPGAIALGGSRPGGVLNAGQAQDYLNKKGYLPGKNIFILGSGDIGLIMARRFSLEGAKVIAVAEIKPYCNGLERNRVQCLEDFGIPLLLSHTVTKVIGKKRVEAVEVSKVDEKGRPIEGTAEVYPCDALVLSVGLIPMNVLLNNLGAEVGPTKGAKVDDSLMTSVPGFYSCGNVLHIHDLADDVVKEARVAGSRAAAFALGHREETDYVSTLAGEGLGYLIPGRINLKDVAESFSLKFRTAVPSKNKSVMVRQGDKVLKKVFKLSLLPSEMQIIEIPRKLLENNHEPITVSIEGGAA